MMWTCRVIGKDSDIEVTIIIIMMYEDKVLRVNCTETPPTATDDLQLVHHKTMVVNQMDEVRLLNACSSKTDYSQKDISQPPPLMVEAQGFWVKDDFYVKQLAFFNPISRVGWEGTFKPPFDKTGFKPSYLKKLLSPNGDYELQWEEGEYPYSLAITMIAYFAQHYTLYSNGRFKCQWFEKFASSSVIDLEDHLNYGPHNRRDRNKIYHCSTHGSELNCACPMKCCFKMGDYFMKARSLQEYF